MSTTPSSLFSRRAAGGAPPTGRRHPVLRALLVIVVLLALLVAGLSWYASTPGFANKVRAEVIKTLGDATGGRVELGAFRWRLLHLQIEADNLTIHGLEGPGQVPYLHVDRLLIRAKIISLFRARIGLRYLGIDKPVVHLIVYKDGSTNQPVPKRKSAPANLNKTINEVFDLQADRAEINDGTALLNQRAVPFSLAANDVEVGVNYLLPSDQYKATLSIADITARRSLAAPLHSRLTLDAFLGRNHLSVPDLHFSSGASSLTAQASLSNYNNPFWQVAAKGAIDLREAQALAAVPGIEGGTVALDLHGQGTGSLFTVDGTAKVAGAGYRTSGINLRGLDASTAVHLTQETLALQDLRARLASGGTLVGDAHIDNWLAPGAATAEAAAKSATRPNTRANPGKNGNQAAGARVSSGVVNARLAGFTLPSILSILAPPKFQHLGFFTVADGTVRLTWTGDASDLAADARIQLTAPATPPNGEVPVNGTLDATYAGRSSSVTVRQFNAHTPGTQLNVTGGIGLAAGARSSLQTQLTVSNLGEFNQALAAFGVGGKLPVALHGQASFNGVVTGSLAAPDVTGHLTANNFDVLLNNAPAAPSVATAPLPTNPAGQPVPVPVAAAPQPGVQAPSTFHIDSLTADAEYSPALISVQSALITHGVTQLHASGQLHAHKTRRKGYLFDNDATIHGNASINNAAVGDLLALAGQSVLPVTGTLNLSTNVGGTLGNLTGGGHLAVTGGQIYGEPYRSLNADLTFAGQEVGASQFTLLVGGGQIAGNGGYNLASKHFHALAQTPGLNLDNFQLVKQAPLVVHGQIAFNVQASGTVQQPIVQATVRLSPFSLSNPAGGPPSAGSVDLTAHMQGGDLLTDLNARLNGATATLHARTTLAGDYNTQAQVALANLDLNPLFQLFNVNGIKGESTVSGDIHVDGPIGKPRQLDGDASLSRIAISAQGITLGTQGGLRASLRDGIVAVEPVHITGGGTNLEASGRAALFGTNRLLSGKADGTVDLQVAHTLDPDISSSGQIAVHFTVGNTIERPDFEGSADFHDVNLAYGDFPNGINHLTGSLVFNQGRLTAKDLKATSGGGDLTFGGFVTYQAGVYADLSVGANQVRVRYPGGVSTTFDSKLRIQGTLQNILVSGGLQVTRFAISPGFDASALSSNGISPPPDPNAFGNRVRLDVHVTSSPQLDINNTYAKLSGDVDLFVRGTAASPSVLGHISITEGSATFAGTHYTLQHGDIYFTNPVKIDPTIDLEASAHVEDYDIVIGLHGTTAKLTPTFRSEPPLSEQDIFSLLSVGRTQEEAAIYSEQQSEAGVNSTADAILGGALNATLSSRINKLFGGGSVKIDPTFVSGAGNATARITVQQQVSTNGTVTYATNVNSTAQQLIQGQYNITPNLSVLAVRDESGVFSLEIKLHQRYR